MPIYAEVKRVDTQNKSESAETLMAKARAFDMLMSDFDNWIRDELYESDATVVSLVRCLSYIDGVLITTSEAIK